MPIKISDFPIGLDSLASGDAVRLFNRGLGNIARDLKDETKPELEKRKLTLEVVFEPDKDLAEVFDIIITVKETLARSAVKTRGKADHLGIYEYGDGQTSLFDVVNGGK